MSKDYYKILGVEKNASQDEIKKAFRKKAHQHHPDKSGGDEAKFKEANEAYQVLGDENKRSQYDQFGSSFQNGQAGGASGAGGFGGWEDIFRQAGQQTDGFNVDFSDFFSGFGGGSSRSRGSSQVHGSDIEARMSIDFREAVFGAEKEISLNKNVICSKCSGNGAEPGSKINTCKTCNGSGQVTRVQRTILGNIQTATTCSDCHGEGKTYEHKCKKCHGAGVVKDSSKIKFKIPAGINNGETIRLTGEGEAGSKGGRTGDLYITFSVQADKNFKREGDNIVSREEITISQAILGGKIEIETINGKVSLKIPAGTQSGKVFKLKDEGVPHLRHTGKGDHLVEVVVIIPETLTKKQRELIEEFAQTEKKEKKSGFWG
jgi:molecular chaperone DnaJ